MNCKAILTTAAAGAVLSVFSAVPAPEVSVSGMSQDSKGVATISYTLSAADAVVTLDIETNATGNVWASIGGAAVSAATGDVWKKVEQGLRKITWDGATNWADGKIPSSGIRAVVTAWSLDNTPDYMVVDISAGAQPNTQTYYPAADFVPGGVTNDFYKTSTILMRKIMAKGMKWTMGTVAEANSWEAEREQTHQVTLTSNYYIGVYEITQSQWRQVTGYNASYFTVDNEMRPVEKVSYADIRQGAGTASAGAAATGGEYPADPDGNSFLGLLRNKTLLDFDLPSEAQWEFAARAGNGEGRYGDGSSIQASNLNLLCRYLNNPSSNNSASPATTIIPEDGGTARVGSYDANSWGIYDMHGNVWEWCLDWWAVDIRALNGAVNTASASYRVMRGGGCASGANSCRSAFRNYKSNGRYFDAGFRVVCAAGLQ